MPGYPGMFMGAPPTVDAPDLIVPEQKPVTPTRELIIDLGHLARSYGLDPPFEFEFGLVFEGDRLIMRGQRRPTC